MPSMQAALDPATAGEHRSAWTAWQQVRQTTGVSSLFAGFAPRAFRIMGASIILQVGCSLAFRVSGPCGFSHWSVHGGGSWSSTAVRAGMCTGACSCWLKLCQA